MIEFEKTGPYIRATHSSGHGVTMSHDLKVVSSAYDFLAAQVLGLTKFDFMKQFLQTTNMEGL